MSKVIPQEIQADAELNTLVLRSLAITSHNKEGSMMTRGGEATEPPLVLPSSESDVYPSEIYIRTLRFMASKTLKVENVVCNHLTVVELCEDADAAIFGNTDYPSSSSSEHAQWSFPMPLTLWTSAGSLAEQIIVPSVCIASSLSNKTPKIT